VVPVITDPEGDPFTITWAGVPEGALINGVYFWTPSEDQGPGEYLITVTATQDSNPSNNASQSFMIMVKEVDDPPIIEPIAGFVVDEGSELTVIPRVSDSDCDLYTITWSGVPEGALINGTFKWHDTPGESRIRYKHVCEKIGPSLIERVAELVAVVQGPVRIEYFDGPFAMYLDPLRRGLSRFCVATTGSHHQRHRRQEGSPPTHTRTSTMTAAKTEAR